MQVVRTRMGLVVAGVLVALSASAQDASVYKWVDQNGTVNYGDQPPAGAAVEALPIRSRRSERSAAPGRASTRPREEAAPEPDAENGEKAADADDEAAGAAPADEREKLLAQRQDNCKRAKQRMASYEQARRIYRPGAGGERVYLSDDELDAERATARVAVAEWCDE